MDKNSVIGFLLIGVVMVFFYIFTKPTPEEIARMERYQDSIAQVESVIRQEAELDMAAREQKSTETLSDSALTAFKAEALGEFSPVSSGEEQFITLENEKLEVVISTKGARVYKVRLKEYLTHDKKPLILFDGDESQFNFNFFTKSNRKITTDDIYFVPQTTVSKLDAGSDSAVVTFTATTTGGSTMNFTYTLPKESYQLKFKVQGDGLEEVLPRSTSSIDLKWSMALRQNEKGRKFEDRYSGLYYKFYKDDVESLTTTKDDSDELTTRVKWIGYKDQFFSSVLIADDFFTSANIAQKRNEEGPYLKHLASNIAIPLNTLDKGLNFQFYFGPNHYQTLKKVGHDLKGMLNLGWWVLKYVNQVLVIPVFNWLDNYIGNYGIIILILTVFIKLLIFPFTYKSYKSTAKMRVLKPQIDEINEKFTQEQAMERQKATMSLYRKAGVNPMGGCLPMVFQFPILIAMFYFFPASIELRQQSFLWATDLASYDAIFTWTTQIPLLSEFYGNHVSLFCLLMAFTNLFYTHINQEMTASTTTVPGMKMMMYTMPLFFLFIFNNYAAGLSYYYFISTLITIGQTFLMRRFVNEEAILAKLKENQKKPKKKSKFQDRIEQMQKQQQTALKQRAKQNKR